MHRKICAPVILLHFLVKFIYHNIFSTHIFIYSDHRQVYITKVRHAVRIIQIYYWTCLFHHSVNIIFIRLTAVFLHFFFFLFSLKILFVCKYFVKKIKTMCVYVRGIYINLIFIKFEHFFEFFT